MIAKRKAIIAIRVHLKAFLQSSESVPSTTLCPPLRYSVPSMALCHLFSPLPPLWPSVPDMAVCPISSPLSPLQFSVPSTLSALSALSVPSNPST
jgi:hypothetical protein